jgi:release factor glutamine methyltransferase
MQQAIEYIKKQLQSLYSDGEIRSLSRRILETVCGADAQAFANNRNIQLSSSERVRIQSITEELKAHRPLQYVLGKTEFYGLPFLVNSDVLIPRPETEELVEWILQQPPKPTKNEPCRIIDIGTGSGCIAVALAKQWPQAEVYALDISKKALAVAEQNARENQVNIRFFRQNILSPDALFDPAFFDLIVSNPPYIRPSEQQEMAPNVLHYEPHSALFVPENHPLLFYERIADWGQTHLKHNGQIFFETNAAFGQATANLLYRKKYRSIQLRKDISGKDRMITGRFHVSEF